jgi:hypothetical protein
MNLEYLHGRFLENGGVIPSKAMRVKLLAELSTDNDVYGGARSLNAI